MRSLGILQGMNSRFAADFIKGALLVACCGPLLVTSPMYAQPAPPTFEAYLRKSVVDKKTLDVFLDAKELSWAKFDPITGYRLGNYMPRDGIDRSSTISTSRSNGMRTAHAYLDKACRINTYGNSFTLCHQVSDSETWQEYLAGHLGEPIRNFGVGGYGVYQAYRRMIREERTNHGTDNLILYIWGDDHIRSLLRCRHAIIYKRWSHRGGAMFHANFWVHLEMNLETGRFVEKENPLNTPAALYRMTEPRFMVDNLKDDLALQLYATAMEYSRELDRERISKLAAHLGYRIDWSRHS